MTCRPTRPVNYARLDWLQREHVRRYRARVEAMPRKLVCQECRGAGEYVETISWELGGPYYDCGWCRGTGYVTPHDRGLWLRCRPRRRKLRLAAPAHYGAEA